jgi:hypothetical protein
MLRRSRQLLGALAKAGAAATEAQQLQSFRSIQYFNAPNGPAVKLVNVEDEWYLRQRNILPLLDKVPWYQADTYVAPNAVVVGDVDLYDQVRAGWQI